MRNKLAGLLDRDAKCNTQGRIPWIDNMRGLLIFTVVLGHVIFGENSFLTTAIGYTHYLIYSVHMSLFFMLSGYLSKRNFTFSKVIFNFFLPYAFFDFFYVCWSYLRGMPDSVNKFIIYPSSVYWFILSLGMINLLASKISLRGFTILTVFMYIVFAFVPNDSWEFLALGRTALMLPAYLIGMLLKKYFADFRRYNTWFIVSGVICIGVELLLAIRGIVPIYWSTHDYNGNNMQYVMKLLYICFFAFFEFALISICVTNKTCILTKWGENSLIIYLIHVLFLDVFKTIMISRFGIYWLYWRKWMFPVVILLTALLVQFLSLDIWKRIYDIIFSIPQSIWKKISSSKKS